MNELELLASLDLDGFHDYIVKLYKTLKSNFDEDKANRLSILTELKIVTCACGKKVVILGSRYMKDTKCTCGKIYAWRNYANIEENITGLALHQPEIRDSASSLLFSSKQYKTTKKARGRSFGHRGFPDNDELDSGLDDDLFDDLDSEFDSEPPDDLSFDEEEKT